jgi:hypothetical protein
MIDGHHMDITSIRNEQASALICITGIASQRRERQRSSFEWLYSLIPDDCGANLDKSRRSA